MAHEYRRYDAGGKTGEGKREGNRGLKDGGWRKRFVGLVVVPGGVVERVGVEG